jgi:hypothetical protein
MKPGVVVVDILKTPELLALPKVVAIRVQNVAIAIYTYKDAFCR